jgi:hypothetical protein
MPYAPSCRNVDRCVRCCRIHADCILSLVCWVTWIHKELNGTIAFCLKNLLLTLTEPQFITIKLTPSISFTQLQNIWQLRFSCQEILKLWTCGVRKLVVWRVWIFSRSALSSSSPWKWRQQFYTKHRCMSVKSFSTISQKITPIVLLFMSGKWLLKDKYIKGTVAGHGSRAV